ncbi:XdhC family protein [Alteromonas sp. 5E99-2]|uniref:XdhC family protein n=1 Tax=Alteromonas sp. 5E99-2 TaxID=2817683 RepID=UPI001A99099D|nr:XdhC family protein [Alteromonas sp. 5E99-2]MBO1256156.1 XdhC family protein [Alteromonas sp. 5E99-2]
MNQSIQQLIQQLIDERKHFIVATVVGNHGSVSAKTGSKAVINDKGELIFGWIGGGCAESETCFQSLEALNARETRVFDIDLDDEMLGVGMPCGGAMSVYVEPYIPKPKLWLIGHGEIVKSLSMLGNLVGLEVIINDTTASFEQYPDASSIINDDLNYSQLQPSNEDFVIIATQHKGDHLSMTQALKSGAKYIALVASKKRAKLVLEYLREVSPEQLENSYISTPAGVDIGAKTPQEIALSVIAEVVMHRRDATGNLMKIDEKQHIAQIVSVASK